MERPVELALEEYRALADEAQGCIGRQRQILQLGLATLGVTIGLGAQLGEHPRTSGLMLAGLVPTIAAASLFLWLQETEQRAQIGLQQIKTERVLNELAGKEVLSWQRRRAMNALAYPRRASRSIVVAILLLACAGFGVIAGLYSVRHWPGIVGLLAALDVALIASGIWFLVGAHKRFRTMLDTVRAEAHKTTNIQAP